MLNKPNGDESLSGINWRHTLLIGNVPANCAKHKLRYHIEQKAGNPVQKFEMFKVKNFVFHFKKCDFAYPNL